MAQTGIVPFVYYYKTADGVRRSGEMSAASRDDVFAALRLQGIRPIKVLRKDDLNPVLHPYGVKKRWVAVLLVFAIVMTGAALYWIQRSSGRHLAELRDKMTAFAASANSIADGYRRELASLELEDLRDCAKIAQASGPDVFAEKLKRIRTVIARSREKVKDHFRSVYEIFPAEARDERRGAQILYGEIMSELDAFEERVDSDEIAIELLLSHRDAWRLADGRVVFLDMALEREFRFFQKEPNLSASRWQKDFMPSSPTPVPKDAE